MKPAYVDQLREEEDVRTVNAMLKDGWVLLEISQIKRGPLYILGKRIVSKLKATAEVLPEEPPALGEGSDTPALPEA